MSEIKFPLYVHILMGIAMLLGVLLGWVIRMAVTR